MLAVLTLDSRGGDIGHIASSLRLGDGNTCPLPSGEEVWQKALLELNTTELDYWRDSIR